jgi:hypothetical protein
MKEIFDKRTKERNFMVGDMVLKWDARRLKGNMRNLTICGLETYKFL